MVSVTWEDVILSKSYVGKNLLDTDYDQETVVGTCAVLGTRNGNTVTNVELDLLEKVTIVRVKEKS